MVALNSYLRKDYSFHYLKTKDGAEVDLVVSRPGQDLLLIEVKSSKRVDKQELKNLQEFSRDLKKSQAICLSLDSLYRREDGIDFYHWRDGLDFIFT